MISPDYIKLLEEMQDMHRRKNAGYAGADNPDTWANFRQCEAFGVPAHIGCAVRLSDKFIRLTNLIKDMNNDQLGESLEDTCLDLAAYALIEICLYREYRERKHLESVRRESTELRNPTPDPSGNV